MTSANGQRTTTQWHDGDGEAVRVERRRTQPTLLVTTAYYVRSSVLGGHVVTELNPSGHKVKGKVYLGGAVLGVQDGVNAGAVARHEDPVTGSYGESFPQGTFYQKTQNDPMGVNVGLVDPFIEEVEYEPDMMMAKVVVNRGGQCGGCPRCFADGIELDCRIAAMMLMSEAAVRCPDDDCGPRTVYNPTTRQNELRPLTWSPNTGQLGHWDWERRSNLPDGPDTDDTIRFGSWDWFPVFRTGSNTSFFGVGFGGMFFLGVKVGRAIGPQNTTVSQQETKECADMRAKLLGDPMMNAALDDVWNRSQASPQHPKQEEGGLLGRTGGAGLNVDSVFTRQGKLTGALEGFSIWADKKIRHNKGTVTYEFWYHSHPHDEFEKVPGEGIQGTPDFPSPDDLGVSKDLGLLGILVSKKHIVVFDKKGFIRCHFDR